jgi:hypothetical protein
MEYEMQTDSRRLNYHALQSECVLRAHTYTCESSLHHPPPRWLAESCCARSHIVVNCSYFICIPAWLILSLSLCRNVLRHTAACKVCGAASHARINVAWNQTQKFMHIFTCCAIILCKILPTEFFSKVFSFTLVQLRNSNILTWNFNHIFLQFLHALPHIFTPRTRIIFSLVGIAAKFYNGGFALRDFYCICQSGGRGWKR